MIRVAAEISALKDPTKLNTKIAPQLLTQKKVVGKEVGIPGRGYCGSNHSMWTKKKKKLPASQVALVAKNSPANAEDTRDTGSISGLGRSPGEGNGNPLQYSCQEIPWTEKPGRLNPWVPKSWT